MSTKQFLMFPFAIALFLVSIPGAQAFTRDQLMQKEMNCIHEHLSNTSSLGWKDICYTSGDSQGVLASSQIQKKQEVNDALDAYDTSREPMEIDSDQLQEPVQEQPLKQKSPKQVPEAKSLTQEINNFIKHKVHEVEFGTEISHITYQEPIFELKSRGMLYGLYGVYTFRPDKDMLFGNQIINLYRLDAKWSFGQMDYASTSGTIHGIEDNLFEMRMVGGYEYFASPNFSITPYFGIGYRRLSDDASGKQTASGAAGYGRVANYLYMPIGVELSHQLQNQWEIGGTGEFDLFLWGQQDSYLSDVDPTAYPDLHNYQKHGFGTRASLKLVKHGGRYSFLIEPFIRYWHIKDSKISYAIDPSGTSIIGGLEPNNKSTEIGAKLGLEF